jgi:hypothetical protein
VEFELALHVTIFRDTATGGGEGGGGSDRSKYFENPVVLDFSVKGAGRCFG